MPTTDTLVLLAPVTGPLLPLDQVPDPVFAEKMVGDGVSIDPVSSQLVAPCDAEVLTVHPSGHAITLRTPNNVELILHIGLDTVALRGEGFLPLKKKGDRVRAGEPLIDFAADYIATRAPSLLTQMVISNGEAITNLKPRTGFVVAGRDVVLEATLAKGAPPVAPVQSGGDTLSSRELEVLNPTGLHARPAAVIASAARKYTSDVRVRRGKDEANARSVTGIMAMEIGPGDRIVITASGPDAGAALAEIVPLVEAGLGETAAPAKAAVPRRDEGIESALCLDPARCITGAAASPGLAIGTIVHLASQDLPAFAPAGTVDEEGGKLERALTAARKQLDNLSGPGASSTVEAGIFRAHRELLDDPDLVDATNELIAAGTGAGAAWHQAFTQLADRMAAARSDLFAQRAADVRDVGRRVLRLLAGTDTAVQVFPDDAIVVAHELTPSDAAAFDKSKVRGFCTVTGGTTSHVAILARSLGIPAVVAIDPRAMEIPPGTRAIVDGSNGAMMANPTDADVAQAQAVIDRIAARRVTMAATAHEPAVTLDGVAIEVAANIGAIDDITGAAGLGADGVGLLRSEFLFLDRSSAPDEDEQYEAYAKVVTAFGPGARIVIRTLDVGGDKPLAYLPLPREENPFLGIRGIRVSLQREDMLRTQLRAILRAARHGNVHVMFPMVTNIDELRRARRLLEIEGDALGVSPIPAGVMVEVPSVALMADVFAAEADFFSIGTNDLTQYTLAIDRGQPALAAQVDALHPAVLKLIAQTTAAARANGRWTGVCGALASEEAAVPILLGLGVTELSASGPVVPAIKAKVRLLRMSECRSLAETAMRAPTAADVRALLRS